ncbi:STAS domain-containing protein [Peribacillus sp. SCS-155]|uniref:STAS domain-containing protein n=1 Tax=Peribacillus sedimenti TaxID=3115297 RepID=UPI003906141B
MQKTELELLQEQMEQYKHKIKEYEQLIQDISVPIIQSVVPDTLLLPVSGKLSPERFEIIYAKLMDYSRLSEVSWLVVDFTAISVKEIGEMDTFGRYIENIHAALKLMGVQVIFSGFTPGVSQELVRSGLSLSRDFTTFSTFRKALQYIMDRKGLVLTGK